MQCIPMALLIPVILAGGSGTRLWPVSRETFPKQLVRLSGDGSLLQQTARRLLAEAPPERIVTVGAKSQDFLVARQLSEVAPGLGRHRLLEPEARNTAAAIALAALYARARMDADALLWVCPSDHLMRRPERLLEALARAVPAAEAGEIVTFGIEPTRPETGYGYLQAGRPLSGAEGLLRAQRFVEKPERALAEEMLAAGGHFWNGGIFLFRGDRLLEELKAHRPDILGAVERAFAGLREGAAPGAFEVPPELYEAVPAAPIDKAVMEQTSRIVVVPCDPGWSDVGSWQALWEQLPKDEADNAISGDAWLDGAERCLVHAERRLVVCSGVRDLAVVETDDAVLVADLARGDAVRTLVTALKDAGRPEALAHGEEHRPWGSFRVLHEGPGFKIKEIVVAPGGRLSLQSHRHRAEHWVVVAGTARVTVDDQVLLLEPNQNVHIPLGARHRMENPGQVPMHLIEVQCGDYLGEDDIIRYEDVYGRS
jgi:mannose-1-phosphate guanylyltransferase / mannose-6-phosphate isomerase